MDSSLTRRSALFAGLGGLLAAAAPGREAGALGNASNLRIRALAFDGFTILDPRALTAAVIAMFPDHGAAIANAWTTKLFELSWIETAAGRYSGFARLADAALKQVAQVQDITIDPTQRAELIGTFGALPIWPDAADALENLRRSGIRLAFLSNLEERDLASNMRRHGLLDVMEPPLSTNRVRAFKPSPRAYAMGTDYFQLPRDQIGFVAFGGWDALGAKWFGYPTAWINRLGVAPEALDPAPDASGPGLSVVSALLARQSRQAR
jgi:2-haloacid dehalogenase